MSTPETADARVRELTLRRGRSTRRSPRRCAAIRRSFLIGEDVAEAGTTFKVLAGLVDEFGTERIIDTPISEAGLTGLGVGAAMTGLRPVVDIMFGDFLTLIMDQLVNQAAKIHYMSGGKLKVPMVLRTTLGATRRSAAQHSQSLHAWLGHIPGLKVVVPVDAVRREGPVQGGDPRRQPGGHLRGQDELRRSRGRCPTTTT